MEKAKRTYSKKPQTIGDMKESKINIKDLFAMGDGDNEVIIAISWDKLIRLANRMMVSGEKLSDDTLVGEALEVYGEVMTQPGFLK